VQTDYILWKLSADGGAHWEIVAANTEELHEFAYPGTLLMWKTTHFYASNQTNPSCTWMSIEYFKDETGVDDDGVPVTYALRQNLPNPFRGGTSVRYDVPVDGAAVRLEVYDVTGRRVRTLFDGPRSAGSWAAVWDGRDERGARCGSGVYYCRLSADGHEKNIKMTLLR